SPIEILHKHCMEPPPSLETVGVGLPPHVYQAVDRALAKKPEQRFRSVGAFVEALRHPAPDATLPSLGAARMPAPAPAAPTGRRTKLVVPIHAAAGSPSRAPGAGGIPGGRHDGDGGRRPSRARRVPAHETVRGATS